MSSLRVRRPSARASLAFGGATGTRTRIPWVQTRHLPIGRWPPQTTGTWVARRESNPFHLTHNQAAHPRAFAQHEWSMAESTGVEPDANCMNRLAGGRAPTRSILSIGGRWRSRTPTCDRRRFSRPVPHRCSFTFRWRPVRELNPRFLIESQGACRLAERDLAPPKGIEPSSLDRQSSRLVQMRTVAFWFRQMESNHHSGNQRPASFR